MQIPFEPVWFGVPVNVHLLLEYAAFFLGFRYYVYLKKRTADPISGGNRLSIIIGAVFGALVGSRVIGYLEHPMPIPDVKTMIHYLFGIKTIMGGLFGGLLGVELSKKIIGEQQSSGDLFTFPIILGIAIGRVGCFLSGVNEFTYGSTTSSLVGMDLGDGIPRHPIALYEILFLILLWIVLCKFRKKLQPESGLIFKLFMLSYFGFRFLIEFLKPNTFLIASLSSIQYLCIFCWIYYWKTILRGAKKVIPERGG